MAQEMEGGVRVKEQFIIVDNDNVTCLYVDAYEPAITELMKMAQEGTREEEEAGGRQEGKGVI